MRPAPERRVLNVVGDVIGLLELDELCHGMIEALRREIPSEISAINEIPGDVPGAISLTDPVYPTELHALFARLGHENPIARYFRRTHDGRAMRFSDLVTRKELHALELYRELYGPMGIEYQVAFGLPSGSERILGIALSRSHADFTDEERDLLTLARPYLIQAYRNALEHTRLAWRVRQPIDSAALLALGLTARQAEVVRLVARGHSDRDAAAQLGISLRTTQKHLERAYRVLGVKNRSQAAQRAWSVAGARD